MDIQYTKVPVRGEELKTHSGLGRIFASWGPRETSWEDQVALTAEWLCPAAWWRVSGEGRESAGRQWSEALRCLYAFEDGDEGGELL